MRPCPSRANDLELAHSSTSVAGQNSELAFRRFDSRGSERHLDLRRVEGHSGRPPTTFLCKRRWQPTPPNSVDPGFALRERVG